MKHSPLLLPRVRRGADERFVPGERVAVVSLPWWDAEHREVVFVDLGHGWERTIVVTWATVDAEGLHLDVRAIRSGDGVRVLPWDVEPPTRAAIDEITRVWAPPCHDIYVCGGNPFPSVGPALGGLLEVAHGLDLKHRVELAIDRWCSARSDPAA